MQNETLTNIFWGIFFIWFGVLAAYKGNFEAALNDEVFAIGTGVTLIAMNLVRSLMRLRVSVITLGLGAIVTVFYAPLFIFQIQPPSFMPLLLVILGATLIIGAFKTRSYL